MSAPKVGDRVRVEFEGEVVRGFSRVPEPYTEVRVDGGAPGGYVVVRPDHCTVIAPPVKVGDKVTPKNIDALPDGSIIAYREGPAMQRKHDVWLTVGDSDWQKPEDVVARWPATVLRIGGGS